MSMRQRAALYFLALVAFIITPFIAVYALYRQYVLFCLNIAEGVIEDVKNSKGSDRS